MRRSRLSNHQFGFQLNRSCRAAVIVFNSVEQQAESGLTGVVPRLVDTRERWRHEIPETDPIESDN